MNIKKNFIIAIVFGAMIAIAATAPPVYAHRSDPAVNVLPPVGVALGQTLRVSFLNVGSNPLEIVPCIFDGDGAHLKTGATITLAPGQTRSFDLSRSEIAGRTERSVEVRAGVHANRPDLKNLVASGELIEDATGKTSLYVGEQDPPDTRSASDVTISPVGIVAGQSLRVTYFNNGRSPLEIVPCIFDGDGAHLRSGPAITLQPGQMRSIEITWNEAAAGRTERSYGVRGAVHVLRDDAKHLVMAGEVVEDATGKSSLYVAPGTTKGFDPQPDPPAAR